MEYKRGRFSWLLRPLLIVYDIFIINLFAHYLLDLNDGNLYFFSLEILNNKELLYIIYSIIFWIVSTAFLKFYDVYRYTSFLNIISLLFKQLLIFIVSVFAFIGIFRSINIQAFVVFNYILYTFIAIGFIKVISFLILKSFRAYLNGNIRKIVIIGYGKNVEDLIHFFTTKKELGYIIKATFSDNNSENVTGTIKDSFNFLKNNESIDEIYCAIDQLSDQQVNQYVKYANINHSNIKFIPKTSKLFTKKLRADYYAYQPILSIQEGPLSDDFNKFIKRGFDVLFSLFTITFILSWLSVILFILIKLESKGPLFYKHKRNGIDYKEFDCYKYRSLKTTEEVKGTYVKPQDPRLTKIGKFLRRTNMDELPQFVNVLIGEMSVVGPRPHMLSYTDEYSKVINKYNFIYRHHIKPGITGLAQVSGFRGEVETDNDIINRVKYDNFYIENWSILLDLKIIFQTIANIIKGEEKAY
ncbi:exopolysaccharide biosynthesis polyprenyl glycosylphosphotransferase [Algibacter aquimarinus]|uniref:Undecaprenyl-phosphate glucose phosphotransferase n=1 Tax=Algibacter aquimarinus TaxID=1136748 RepID=A0ABP9HCN6_9FLAO